MVYIKAACYTYIKTRRGSMLKKHLTNKILGLLTFFIPIFVMVILIAQQGIYPFGENTILTVDLRGQYIGMLAYLRDIYLGKGSLVYAFSKGLGGNMSGLFAYYLASPLNLILLLFSKYHITEAILVITLIKIGLCGVTSAIYLNKHFHKYDGSILVFSSCYALMSYNIWHLSNIMWLDGVIWLPVILLGIERLIKKQKIDLYVISLAISIYSNYYIGYMLCLASVLYFIYNLFIKTGEAKQLRKTICKFILASLTAGSLIAFLLFPTLLSLRNGKTSFRLTQIPIKLEISLSDLLSKCFIGSFNGEQLENGFPVIFIGSLTLSLVLGYFLNKRICVKEKIASASMLIIFYLSFSVSTLNLIWHGFDYPVCFPYRNAFIVNFFLITLAYKCFVHLEGIRLKHYITIIGIWSLLGGVIWWKNYGYLSEKKIILTLFFVFLGCLCLYIYTLKSKKAFLLLEMLIVYSELLINGWTIEEQFSYFPRKYIVNSMKCFAPVLENLTHQNDFFRLEEFYQAVDTEPMLFGYNGINHSSSAIDKSGLDFLKKLGVCSCSATVNQKYIEGGTLPTDMLLGIKYYLIWHQYKPIDYLSTTWGAQSFYPILEKSGSMTVYKNPYALPVGYSVSKEVLRSLPNTTNVFDIQNHFLNQLNDTSINYYEPVTIQNVSYSNILQKEENGEVVYTKQDITKKATITYKLAIENHAPLYMYLTSPRFQSNQLSRNPVEIYVNGIDASYYFLGTTYGIKNLGTYEEGESITVTLELIDSQFSMQDSLFYTLDLERFKTLNANLRAQSISVTHWHEGYIEGDITIQKDNQLLMTSILYDPGWQINVDGKKQVAQAIQDALLGISLDTGLHHIIMSYEVPGLKIGRAISLVTLILLISYHLYQLRRRQQ